MASGVTNIDIEGTLNDHGRGGARHPLQRRGRRQITIGADGLVQSLNGDAIQEQAANATVNLTNLARSSPTRRPTRSCPAGRRPAAAFALNFNAALGAVGAPVTDFTSGGTITNGAVDNTTALIQSNSGDAIRLGSHETLINYGTIKGNGAGQRLHNNNNVLQRHLDRDALRHLARRAARQPGRRDQQTRSTSSARSRARSPASMSAWWMRPIWSSSTRWAVSSRPQRLGRRRRCDGRGARHRHGRELRHDPRRIRADLRPCRPDDGRWRCRRRRRRRRGDHHQSPERDHRGLGRERRARRHRRRRVSTATAAPTTAKASRSAAARSPMTA